MKTIPHLVGTFFISALAASAQVPHDWQPKVEELKRRFFSETADRITIESIAKENGLPYPLATNRRTHQEIEELARLNTQRHVDQTIPLLTREMAEKTIHEKYRPWERRERISFADNRGRKYEGYMTGAYPNLRINGISVPIVDLPTDVRVHFEPELAKQLGDREIGAILRKNQHARETLTEEYMPKEKERLYKSYGFPFYAGSYRETATVERDLASIRDAYVKRECDRGLEAFLNKHGYAMYDGNWMPAEMAKQKELARQAEQARLAAEQEQQRRVWEAEQARLAAEREQLRQQQEADRKARDVLRAKEAESCANEQIPAVIIGMLKAQAQDEWGTAYWDDPTSAKKMFAPTSWEIKKLSVSGTTAMAKVLIESSTKGGIPIRKFWNIFLVYKNSWKVSDILE